MKRPCQRCKKIFQPTGKFGKICNNCCKRPQEVARRIREEAYNKKKKKIGL